MILATMRFKGYTWHHNPKYLEINDEKTTNEMKIPYSAAVLQSLGRKSRTVKGVAELYGSDCLKQYDELYKIYLMGGGGMLSLPELSPFYAELVSLKMKAQTTPDVIEYSFVFKERMQDGIKQTKEMFYTVKENGENLWDIAYDFDTTVDELVRLNTQLKYPDELKKGERIRLYDTESN